MATAKFIQKLREWDSNARLYKLSEPVEIDPLAGGGTTSYVVVSASTAMGEPETLIFPSDEHGEVKRMFEIGGWRGTLDHAEVLRDMGFTVR